MTSLNPIFDGQLYILYHCRRMETAQGAFDKVSTPSLIEYCVYNSFLLPFAPSVLPSFRLWGILRLSQHLQSCHPTSVETHHPRRSPSTTQVLHPHTQFCCNIEVDQSDQTIKRPISNSGKNEKKHNDVQMISYLWISLPSLVAHMRD